MAIVYLFAGLPRSGKNGEKNRKDGVYCRQNYDMPINDNFGYKFKGDELLNALLETSIRILGTNVAIMDLLCEIKEDDKEKANELFEVMKNKSAEYSLELLRDLYGRRGSIDI